MRPAAFLRDAALGSRIVVRHLIDDGRATDALGYLRSRDADRVVIETKRGLQIVHLATVVAAKDVPPPPTPRPR